MRARRRQRDFGRLLGIAFQIVDDILDCAGETIETGKIPGTDLRDGTPTLPLLLAAREDEVVRRALAGGPLEGALVRVVATDALERSREVALDYAAAGAREPRRRRRGARSSRRSSTSSWSGPLDDSSAGRSRRSHAATSPRPSRSTTDALGFETLHHDGGFAVLLRDDAVVHLWESSDESWRTRGDVLERPVSHRRRVVPRRHGELPDRRRGDRRALRGAAGRRRAPPGLARRRRTTRTSARASSRRSISTGTS